MQQPVAIGLVRRIGSIVLVGLMSVACTGAVPGGDAAASAPALAAVPAQVTPLPTRAPAPSATPLPDGVLASIPLGIGGLAPSVAAIGFGSVWVETHRGTELYRIDPTTDKVIAAIDVGQESCSEPGIGFGRVWLGPCDSSTKTIAVDATTNQVVGSFDALGGSEAFTADAVWIPDNESKLARIDPKTYKTLATYDVMHAAPLAWVVSAGGWIWAGAEDGSSGAWEGGLAKVDPATGQVVSRLTVPNPGSYATVTADLGYIWIKGDGDGRLVRINPKTEAIDTFDLSGFQGLSQLYDIWPATGLGSVWVRLTDDTVSRVDPETGKVTGTYPADAAGGGGWPTVGFGSLWVPNFGSDSIWRDRVAG
jgi:streptogramin lyase